MSEEFFNLKQKSLFAIHGPMCDCGCETEKNRPLLLALPVFFAENRQKLLNSLFKIDVSLKNLYDEMLLDILLSGSEKYKDYQQGDTRSYNEFP